MSATGTTQHVSFIKVCCRSSRAKSGQRLVVLSLPWFPPAPCLQKPVGDTAEGHAACVLWYTRRLPSATLPVSARKAAPCFQMQQQTNVLGVLVEAWQRRAAPAGISGTSPLPSYLRTILPSCLPVCWAAWVQHVWRQFPERHCSRGLGPAGRLSHNGESLAQL